MFGKKSYWLRWEKTTVDQFDAVVERAAVNLHRSFSIKQLYPGPKFFFVTMFVFLILITLCIVKLNVLKPSIEENSVWISILSSLARYMLPNSMLWIRLYLKQIVSSWLLLYPPRVTPIRLHLKRKFLYREMQSIYAEMATNFNVAFKNVTKLDFVQNVDNYFLIFDDSCEEVTMTRSL